MSRARIQRRIKSKTADPLDAGQEDDQWWFQVNPDAKWRLRPALPGEVMELFRRAWDLALQSGKPPPEIRIAPEKSTHILVTKVAPGVRMRDACRPPPRGAERDAWAERTAAERLSMVGPSVAFHARLLCEARGRTKH